MLHHPTVDKLQALRFTGMLKALQEQQHLPDIDALSFEERLGLLVDREITEREDRRLQTRLRKAQLKHQAAIEDIDYRTPRGLDKALMRQLSSCQWVKDGLNLIINGPTGVGKTWIACALAHKACQQGYTTLYFRTSRLLHELSIAKADGRYTNILKSLGKTRLLVLDDWGLKKLVKEQSYDLLEILEDRHGLRSTLVTSQLPTKHWHEIIADQTLADAILDRLVHNAYKINLKGESMRKMRSNLTKMKDSGK